jgi:RNA polymerase sigma-70 factor, ECF subfamily
MDDIALRRVIAAAQDGESAAIDQFVRATQPAVWRLCNALGSYGEVDDLVQETYLRALRSLPRYRGEASPTVWLLAVARHVCADHVRRRQRHRRLVERIVQRTDRSLPPASSGANQLVDLLDPDRRIAFVLTQTMGLSYEEAASIAECPVGTIRSRVARARADLAALVDEAEAQ